MIPLLADIAPSGIPVIGPVTDLVANFMKLIYENTGRNLAFSIVLFTIVLKTALLPLTLKSIRASKAMQDIAPEIKKLQKQHKDDRAAFSAAQMELYQKYGVNPLAGCLPVLIQLPVFIVVYNAMLALAQDPDLGVQPFLWVADLTKTVGETIPGSPAINFLVFTGNNDPLRILAFLAFFFQVIQTRMSLPDAEKAAQQDANTRSQRLILTASTSLVLFFGWTFLAAMVLYWVVQAIYSVIQQYFITGWGSLTDIFPFLPKKKEAVRVLKEIDPSQRKPPGRFARMMQQAQAQQAQASENVAQDGAKETSPQGNGGQPVKPRQALGPSGRPPRGSTVSISTGGGSTPPQRSGTKNADASRSTGRTKGTNPRPTTAKAIGAAENTDGGGRTTRVNRTNGTNGANGTSGTDGTGANGANRNPVPRRTGGGNRASRATGNESAGSGGE